MKLVYLLIDGRSLIPCKDKWRVFATKEACLEAARKLGYGSGMLGAIFSLGDEPGQAIQEMCGDVNVTMIPVEVEE